MLVGPTSYFELEQAFVSATEDNSSVFNKAPTVDANLILQIFSQSQGFVPRDSRLDESR